MLLKTIRAKMKDFHSPTMFMKTGILCSDTHDIDDIKEVIETGDLLWASQIVYSENLPSGPCRDFRTGQRQPGFNISGSCHSGADGRRGQAPSPSGTVSGPGGCISGLPFHAG
jgi:hypothetical protein